MIDLRTRYVFSAIGGLILSMVVGLLVSFWLFIPVFILSIVGFSSIYIVNEAHGVIVERLGAFNRILNPGFQNVWLPGLYENATIEIFTKEEALPFFEGPSKTVDFIDGSVNPNDCHIIRQIKNPFKKYDTSYSSSQEGLYRYHYNVKNCNQVIIDRVEGCLRAILNPQTIDEGLKVKGINLKDQIDQEVIDEFSHWGIEIKAIIMGDFELLPETRESRTSVYEAEKNAEKARFVSKQRSEEITGTLLEMLCDMTGCESREEVVEKIKNDPKKYEKTMEQCMEVLKRRMSLDHNALRDIRIEGLENSGGEISSALTLFKILGDEKMQKTENPEDKPEKKSGRKFTEEEYEEKIKKMYNGKAI